jgi:hypothetical protein
MLKINYLLIEIYIFEKFQRNIFQVGEHQAPAMMQISAPPPTPQPSSSSSLMMSSMALLPQQPQMAPGSSSSILPIKQETDADREAAVVTRLSQFTGMKPEWARKCLVDCAWDYEVFPRKIKSQKL